MSHYTKVRTKIVEIPSLVKALEDLGFKDPAVYQNPRPLQGWPGAGGVAQVVARAGNGNKYDLGFLRENDGTFSVVVEHLDRGRFGQAWLDKVNQRYAYWTTRTKLEEQGFAVVEEQAERGRVKLLLRRMA